MAPHNNKFSERIWSEEDDNREILRDFLNAGSQELKAMYTERDASTLTEIELRKDIGRLLYKPVTFSMFREVRDGSEEIPFTLSPVFVEVKERTPGIFSLEQMVSIPRDEFKWLWDHQLGFARSYEEYTDEEEKIEDMYAHLTLDCGLCTKDDENYYFLLDPKFDETSPAIRKIQYMHKISRKMEGEESDMILDEIL
jgi:hypothetical protein